MRKAITAISLIITLCVSAMPPVNAYSIITNGSFSDGKSGWAGTVNIVTEQGNSFVSMPEGRYIYQNITSLFKGAEYTVTARLKSTDNTSYFQLVYYDENQVEVGSKAGYFLPSTGDRWETVSYTFKYQKNVNSVNLFVMAGGSAVSVDDIEMSLTKAPPRFFTDAKFVYYTQEETSRLTITPNTSYYNMEDGDNIDVVIKKDNLITFSSSNIPAAPQVSVEFPTYEAMPLYGQDYTLEVLYKSAGGIILESFSDTISRFSRPSMLDGDNNLIVNNKIFVPTIGYETDYSIFPRMAELGINTVDSCTYSSANISDLIIVLDAARDAGVMVNVVLYPNGKSAGSSENIEKTRQTVSNTKIKTHPALLSYLLMDEPGNEPQMMQELKTAYKLIRSLDSVHPVSICECMPYAYEDVAKCVDTLIIDPYAYLPSLVPDYVSYRTKLSLKAVNNEKPVYAVLRAYDTVNFSPTANDIRHMAYQAFLSGAKGIGYYNIRTDNYTGEIWDRQAYAGVTAFAEDDLIGAQKAFSTGEYEVLFENAEYGSPVWWKGYRKDDNVFLVVLNCTMEQQQASILMANEEYVIGKFTGTAADISGMPDISGVQKAVFALPPKQAVLYKIDYTSMDPLSSTRDIHILCVTPQISGTLLKAKVEFYNPTDKTQDFQVIIAAYSGEKLADVIVEGVTASVNKNAQVITTTKGVYRDSSSGIDKFRIMVWGGLSGLRPLK